MKALEDILVVIELWLEIEEENYNTNKYKLPYIDGIHEGSMRYLKRFKLLLEEKIGKTKKPEPNTPR